MKTRFLLFSVALATIVFSSCSNEDILLDGNSHNDVTNVTTENDDFFEIKENIIEYGAMRAEQNALTVDGQDASDNIKTRGFWGAIGGFAKGLFKSDANGFKITTSDNKANIPQQATRSWFSNLFKSTIETATANAVKSSIQYAVDVFRGKLRYNNDSGVYEARKVIGVGNSTPPVNPSEIALDSVIIFYDSEEMYAASPLDSAGYYHNAAIIDIFKTIPDIETLAAMSDEEISQTVNRSVEHVFKLPEGSIQCEAMHDSISNDVNPEWENLMSVIETYLQNMYETEGLEGDWIGYSRGVMAIISNSNLDSDTKDAMKAVFSVAFASSQLWNIETFKEIIYE